MAVRALARVNLAAIERNVHRLRSELAPGAGLCAVVKADGYGHGAVRVAQAAQRAGATWVAVATAHEAMELRSAGVDGELLVMGALSREELPVVLTAGADLVAWTEEFVQDVERALEHVQRAPELGPVGIHVKLDTGMGRLGTRERPSALRVAERVGDSASPLVLRGAMTHFASADEDPDFTSQQLGRFMPFVQDLQSHWPDIVAHAANSAAVLSLPESHLGLVRCGIAIYGGDPMGSDPAERNLEPALELTSYVAALKAARPGDTVGYGRRFTATRDTVIATIPLGYGDGIARALSGNSDVLIAGRRYRTVGTMSMDNLTAEVGPQSGIEVGDRVTIIGSDGGERQTSEELARRLGTINYEVLSSISPRVPRVYHHDGVPDEQPG